MCDGFVNIYLRFSSSSHPFHRLLRPQRPDQSIAYTACLHWFTLNDRKWRAGVAFVRVNSDLRRGRILLVLSIVSNIATRAASLGYIPQVSQSVHLCKLSARTHERTLAHYTLLMSILIRSRQNGMSALAQRKETGPFGFEGCASESGIPSQGNAMITSCMACPCSGQCLYVALTVHSGVFRFLS